VNSKLRRRDLGLACEKIAGFVPHRNSVGKRPVFANAFLWNEVLAREHIDHDKSIDPFDPLFYVRLKTLQAALASLLGSFPDEYSARSEIIGHLRATDNHLDGSRFEKQLERVLFASEIYLAINNGQSRQMTAVPEGAEILHASEGDWLGAKNSMKEPKGHDTLQDPSEFVHSTFEKIRYYNNLAIIDTVLGRDSEAAASLDRAEHELRASPYPQPELGPILEGVVLGNRAELAKSLGEYPKAMALLRKRRKILATPLDPLHPLLAYNRHSIGEVHASQEHYIRATNNIHRARKDMSRFIYDHPLAGSFSPVDIPMAVNAVRIYGAQVEPRKTLDLVKENLQLITDQGGLLVSPPHIYLARYALEIVTLADAPDSELPIARDDLEQFLQMDGGGREKPIEVIEIGD